MQSHLFRRVRRFIQSLSLSQRFMLASLVILMSGMAGIGAWTGKQIESGVVHRTAATTALYVDSLVAPHLQDLAQGDDLSASDVTMLNTLLRNTALGRQIVSFKAWNKEGQIVYSTEPDNVGQVFPVEEGLRQALRGEVATDISDLTKSENANDRQFGPHLLEIYSPVRLRGTDQVIGVAEFYQNVVELERDIAAAERQSWLIVGAATLGMYLLLAGFVRQASDTIAGQQAKLSDQVTELTALLQQNKELHHRVRRAAARATALNERVLRRISAELHDGPAQDLGLALLRLDRVVANCAICGAKSISDNLHTSEDLEVVQTSLQRAMQEVRAISGGFGLPQLSDMSIADTLARVVRIHERSTNTQVAVSTCRLPDDASLPLKITLYRLVQEALTNAYRHAQGVGQSVSLSGDDGQLLVEVSDRGAGFEVAPETDWDQHLGLAGMRERVESLGGVFQVESRCGQGTRVIARLPLQALEGFDG